MGEKNNGNKKAGDKRNKENGSLTVVLKVDCLCEGCASKMVVVVGGNGGGCDGGNSGGKKNKKGGNGGDGGNDANSNAAATADGGGGKNKTEGNRMEFMVQPEYGYGYTPSHPGYWQPGYGYCYGHSLPHGYGNCYPSYVPNYSVFVHPPHQMFNDENPNACAIL